MVFHKQLSGVGAFALCVSFIAVGHADTPARKQGRREIEAAYAKSARAVMKRDVEAAFAMEAPDYQNFSSAGEPVNRAQEMALLRRVMPFVRSVPKAETKIMSFTWRGPDAIVVSQNTVILMVMRGRQLVRTETVGVSRDYWSHNPIGWQMRQSVGRSEKVWVNGKRFR